MLWYVSGLCYDNDRDCSQNKLAHSMPVGFHIPVLGGSRMRKVNSTQSLANLLSISCGCSGALHQYYKASSAQYQIPFQRVFFSWWLNLDFMFLKESWLYSSSSTTALIESAHLWMFLNPVVAKLLYSKTHSSTSIYLLVIVFEYLCIVIKGKPQLCHYPLTDPQNTGCCLHWFWPFCLYW